MSTSRRLRACVASTLLALGLGPPLSAQIVVSGNENKIELTGGSPKAIPGAKPDSVTVVDFSSSPPRVAHVQGVTNSVVGPPSNIAISPDGKVALIANSIKLDASAAAGFVPDNYVHVMDLTAWPPQVVGRAQTELQPSGLSFTPDGKHVLVANRASGTITLLAMEGMHALTGPSVKVCEPLESLSDVAISPDGKMALASSLKGGYLAVLKIENGNVTFTGRKISVYGQPYRVVISPDGELGLTAGAGFGNGMDVDCLSVVELKGPQPMTTSYVPIGVLPESIEISPDGRMVAAVCMEGSNLAPDNPNLTKKGSLVILQRKAKTFEVTQKLPIGRIPEGVAFTSDNKRIVVQCHPDRQLYLFDVNDGKVVDSGKRIDLPGMASSLRASSVRR